MAAALIAVAGGLLWMANPSGSSYSGKPLRHWLKTLNSEDYRERNRAQTTLRAVGPEALPDLTRAIQARDSKLQDFCRGAIGRLFPARERGIPAARIREQAARLLGTMGPAASPALPLLVASLADTDPEVARAAGDSLRNLGPPSVPLLVLELRSPHTIARLQAADLLGYREDFGDALGAAVGPLVTALKDADEHVRAQTASTLGKIGSGNPIVPTALAAALSDPDPAVRISSALALGRLGTDARPVLHELGARLEDPVAMVRVEAARALWRIEAQPDRVVPTLVAAMRCRDAHWQAALALGEIGQPAQDAIPALLDALQTESVHRPSRTPASSALALGKMSPAAVPGLVELLRHGDPSVRIGAAMALAGHGQHAYPAVPGLLEMLDETDPEARVTASSALGAIGPAASDALPKLEAIAEQSIEYLRAAALEAISRIRPSVDQTARPVAATH